MEILFFVLGFEICIRGDFKILTPFCVFKKALFCEEFQIYVYRKD